MSFQSVQVKLVIPMHAIKVYGGVDLNFHPVVNLSLHLCDPLASESGLFYPWRKIFRYGLKKRLGGSQGGMVAVGGKKS